jgi:hypothetical protein
MNKCDQLKFENNVTLMKHKIQLCVLCGRYPNMYPLESSKSQKFKDITGYLQGY